MYTSHDASTITTFDIASAVLQYMYSTPKVPKKTAIETLSSHSGGPLLKFGDACAQLVILRAQVAKLLVLKIFKLLLHVLFQRQCTRLQ